MKALKVLTVIMLLALALPASALTLITDNGVYKGTPEEIRALQSDVLGAITMLEGQRQATQVFLPDLNNEHDLGSNVLSFKDVYASGTIRTGQIVATSSVLSLIGGQKICIADGTNCAGVESGPFWTYDNAIPGWYHTSTTNEKIGIGDSTPDAQFELAGDHNVLQLLVTGFTSQSQDLLHVASSTNNVVFSIASDGNLAASGTAQFFATSTFQSTAAIRASSTLQVSHAAYLFGTLDVSATTTLSSTAALKASSTLQVSHAASLFGTLAVTGATTLSSTLAVTGATTLTGLLTPNGGISTSTLDSVVVGGSSALAGTFTTLRATGLMMASSSLLSTGLFTPYGGISTSTWDNVTLGVVTPTRASTTLLSVMNTIYIGGTATTTITGAATATSTFSSGVEINEAASTSTLYIGRAGTAGQGGCIVLASGDGSGNLYLFAAGGTLQLSTSTVAKSCF